MKSEEIIQLRKLLPHRYADLISRNLTGISAAKVRGVFGGLINNPDVKEPVLDEAKKLAIRIRKIDSDIKDLLKTAEAN